ncbi:MAG TPA: hypothetical protein VEQ40_03355 [Pyrinomonadaceae bacterium]|nr:hypothetical protein [Pyrinomonadaceae bacterium]
MNPSLPAAAIGLEAGEASAVLLERRRSLFTIKRAATISLPRELLKPSFEETNISDMNELAEALAQLVASAGLQRQKRWSVALPGASTRSSIVTLEGAPASRSELDEVLRWKMERVFGHPVEELRIAHDRLDPDAQGRARYMAVAARLSVRAEDETVFAALGWRAGLIMPRHVAEMQWLGKPRSAWRGDSLLVSSHSEGFTAVIVRGTQPLAVRAIICEPEDRDDELYRLLLFYRDRLAAPPEALEAHSIERLLAVGEGIKTDQIGDVVNDTLGVRLASMDATEVGLALPSTDLDFDIIAAPAGLATMAWRSTPTAASILKLLTLSHRKT